jgi:hypothetical protein
MFHRLSGGEARRSLRHAEQRHLVGMLAGHRQRPPAGGKQEHAGARLQKCVGELGRSRNQVFAVVEDEKHAPGAQKCRDRVRGRPFPVHGQSEHRGNRLADQLGPVQRRQLDEPRAVREARRQISAHL